ncbi:MAG: GntR family transcriptional regulator [Phycisphaerae bacterium]
MDQTANKYTIIHDYIRDSIIRGRFKRGQKLPSDMQIAKQFEASRPTVAKALNSLRDSGLIERKVGSGSYVCYEGNTEKTLTIGLMVPGTRETEIFDPIGAYIAQMSEEKNVNILLGRTISEDAEERCAHMQSIASRYIREKVDGVLFVPLELTSSKDRANTQLVERFTQACIPVVLLDRDIVQPPARSGYDLVSIDNYHVGNVITRHLLDMGYKHIHFLARPLSAPSVNIRLNSFLQTLINEGFKCDDSIVHFIDVNEIDQVRSIVDSLEPDSAFFCANDTTAAMLMHQLDELNVSIPKNVGVAGVDDVQYANQLRVPLTTYRHPCADIARVIMDTMLERIGDPRLPARKITITGELVPRKSTQKND